MKNLFIITKRHGLRVLLSLLITVVLVLHVTKKVEWEFINELELKVYDFKVRLTMPNTADPRVVIVDIDEKSLAEIGHWPWPRVTIAKLIDQLFDTYQIDTLGIDIVFAESADSSGLKILEELAAGPLGKNREFLKELDKLRPNLKFDDLLAHSLKDRQIVLGYIFLGDDTQKATVGQLPPPVFDAETVRNENLLSVSGNGFVANLPILQKNAPAAGHFNPHVDIDGIIRQVPVLYGYQGALYESLALAVTRLALGNPKIELGILKEGSYHHLEFLRLGDRKIYVDDSIRAFVPYRGHSPSFSYISVVDVLKGRIENPNLLKNKIVLLGTTAQGLLDLRSTPIAGTFPGVEIHANLITGILDDKTMYVPEYTMVTEVIVLITVSLIMIFIIPLLGPFLATLSTLLVFGLAYWVNIKLWDDMRFVLPLAPTFLLMVSLLIINMAHGFFVATAKKRQLKDLFGQYVPPELVSEMTQHLGQEFTMEGQSREMTVLFSDVRKFTTISEGLESKELADLMNTYLTPMTAIIHEHRGTIDKYMGDAIMAFWGAPLPDSEHARHSVEAALQMTRRLVEIQTQFQKRGWIPAKVGQFSIGIGLNSGMMSVGNMGSKFRMAYTVMGDAVNLGSRLEGLTKQYGVQIIVSERTKNLAPEYLYRELDQVRVKGKDKPVAIFEPIDLQMNISEPIRAELERYHAALTDYRAQRWEDAKTKFMTLRENSPERLLYEIYLQRLAHFMTDSPPNDWDGVYTFTVK